MRLACAAVALITLCSCSDVERPARGIRPSVVVILTDDQPWYTLREMPTVQHELMDRGVYFSNAFVVNAKCCPSRASLLTGLYSRSTGVYTNRAPHGGFAAFDDDATLATWLRREGYVTGLFGKYLNGYTTERAAYVPPGWQRWNAFAASGRQGHYYDYALSMDGDLVHFGRAHDDYSTTRLGRAVEEYIRSTSGPLFVYFAPPAAHAPYTPPPEGRLPAMRAFRPPSYDEARIADKPRWVRAHRRLDARTRRFLDLRARRQAAALRAVDDAVRWIIDALRDTGRLGRTMIVFASDNGLASGQHRLRGKDSPYEESIRVPLVVRYDALEQAPRTDGRLVLNIDVAPTIVDIARARAPEMDGRSLVPLLDNRNMRWRKAFLIEHLRDRFGIPTYCAIRTRRYKYVVHDTGERELYDLRGDRHEMQNVASAPATADIVERLAARLERLCSPPPPGLALEQ